MGVFFGNLSLFAIACLLFLPVWFALIAATQFSSRDDARPTFKTSIFGLVVLVVSCFIELALLHNHWDYHSQWYHIGIDAHLMGVIVGWSVTPFIASRYSYKRFVYGDKANRLFRKGAKYRSPSLGLAVASGVVFGLFGLELIMDYFFMGTLNYFPLSF
jgi:hypothetical protein